MKLLFTSDPHGCCHPADLRLTELARARGCTVVAIAGDLLDLFAKNPGTQLHSAVGWLRALSTQVPHLAVCSGNHDPDGPEGASWLTRAAANVPAGNLLVDGQHAVLRTGDDGDGDDGVIITCCPYWNVVEHGVAHQGELRARAEAIWAASRTLADRHHLPWVVLHHEPPERTKVAASAAHLSEDHGAGAFWCKEWARTYRPDYLLCGHLHASPFVPGGAWADRVEGTPTWAFNPGRDEVNCRAVEIDTRAKIARWYSSWDGELADACRLKQGRGDGAPAEDVPEDGEELFSGS